MNLNPIVLNTESSNQTRYLTKDQKSIYNLNPWLSKVKNKQFTSEEINKESKRIKVLSKDKSIEKIKDIASYIFK